MKLQIKNHFNWARLLFSVLFAMSVCAPGGSARAEEALQEITVNAGDTMWGIANKYLKDPQKWPEIIKHNNLTNSDPTVALPGIKLKMPVTLIKEEFRTAQIIRMNPEVRYKKKNDSDWKAAKLRLTLGYEDTIRTMKGADVRILFPTREEVQINENSLVILKPEKILQEVQILQGDLRASRAKVIMPSGTVVKPRGSTDYHAKVRDDKSEVVFVYKGEVDVTAQGQTVRVPEGYGTSVSESAPPTRPIPLPSFPDFNPADMTVQAPRTGFEMQVKSAGPRPIEKSPKKESNSKSKAKALVSENLMTSYRVQLGKDAEFKNIVLDKVEPIGQAFEIKQKNIPDGTYSMRLAFIDAFGVQGQWSMPTMVTRDTVAPEFTDLVPNNNLRITGNESYCEVSGIVKGATMVAINGELVFISPEGRFSKFVSLSQGVNDISILARDTQGNETTVQRKVEYAPDRSSFR